MLRFIFSVLLSGSLALNAQNSVIDSLLSKVEGANELELPLLYLEIADRYIEVNKDSVLFFLDHVSVELEKNPDPVLLARVYTIEGELYIETFENEKAIPLLEKALEIYTEENNEKGIAEVLNNLGIVYYNQNDYVSSNNYSLKALDIARSLNDKEQIARSLGFIGDNYLRQNKLEEALENYNSALEIFEELDRKDEIAGILNRLGNYYTGKSEYETAISYFERTLEIRKSTGYKRGEGIALTNIGNQHYYIGNYNEAIEHFIKASEIFKEINFNRGTAATLDGLASIYIQLKSYEHALEVQKEVLEIFRGQNDKIRIANSLSNIGITYSQMFIDSLESIFGRNFQDTILSRGKAPDIEYGRQSVDYQNQALAIRTEIEDFSGISINLANLGNLHTYLGDSKKAREFFNRWLVLPEESKDDNTKTTILIGLGKLAMYEGNYNTAIVYFNQAQSLAMEVNLREYEMIILENLAELHEKNHNYKKALANFRQFHEVSDTLKQERTRELINELQVKYDTEAKEKENELLRKDQEINEAKLKNSRRALVAIIIVVLIFIVLVIQLIRQNTLKRKANVELAHKNQLITEQTKEITDSIQYASRIQNAILPPEEILDKLLPDHFIIYRPRDIVSGDYFWIREKNEKIITIVADCTGHGVPGAFMSMLGVAFLNEIVSKHEELHVDMILNELRKQVIDSLHQTGKEGENQDGMDVALFIIDKNTNELEYSGANNSLLIFRNGEMIELKADKMPIGIHTDVSMPFSRKDFKLKKGDMLYAFSDGYPDQFGGPKGKKFMIRNFKKLLGQIHDHTLSEQKNLLEESLEDWMKDTKQIDDILVMGLRI